MPGRDGIIRSLAKPSRTYRTRVDPFEASASELEHLFENALGQTSRDVFEQLCANNPDSYTSQQFRTFQRRQKRWRAERADAMRLGSGLWIGAESGTRSNRGNYL